MTEGKQKLRGKHKGGERGSVEEEENRQKLYMASEDNVYGVQFPPKFDVVNSASYFLISCYFLLFTFKFIHFDISRLNFVVLTIQLCTFYDLTL